MAEKLIEATWTAFTKKHKLDLEDGPLLKALGRFDKTPETKPQERLESLRDLIEQIKKQVTLQARRKKELGDKVFGEVKDKLYGLLEAAESQLKDAERAAADEGDNEESPALLTTKMVPLLREVRKGNIALKALIAMAGKETVVLLSRRDISPARGKLLKEQMENSSGLKFIRGDCLLEEAAVTFVVQSQAGGLAKRIRSALLAQTDLRVKVRVRGEDLNDIDADGESEGDDDAPGVGDVPLAPPRPPPQVSADQQKFEARLAAIEPRLALALKQPQADASRLRAVSAFAQEKAEGGQFAAALQGLDALEKMLAAVPQGGGGGAPTKSSEGPNVDPAEAFNARLNALMPRIKAGSPEARLKASEAGVAARKRDYEAAGALLDAVERLLGGGDPVDEALGQWKAQRTLAVGRLKAVAAKIASAKHASSAKAIIEIQAVMKNLTAEPSTLQQVEELRRYLNADDVVQDVCELAEDIRTPLMQVLDRMKAELQA